MPAHSNAESSAYDMVVIGGGVYGTAVLWEATHRGLNVLLLEKNDFCSGTSANSLKTIHGGIRYLQNLNLKRTIDSDREKVILKTIAPNIVEPLTCTLAATNYLTKSYLSFFAATKMFNFLSRLSPLGSGRHKDVFTPSSAQRKFSIFNSTKKRANSKAGQSCMVWQDAQVTNSEHLPLAFIRSATEMGSTALNYAKVSDVQPDDSQYKVSYQVGTEPVCYCSAKYVVDCSASASFIVPGQSSADYVCGLNLVLNEQFSEYAYALAVNSSLGGKQGLLFFSPWKGYTIAGTWYYKTSEIDNRDQIDQRLLATCLSDIAQAFSDAGLSVEVDELASMVEDFHLGFLPADLSVDDPEKSIIEKAIVNKPASNYFELRGNKYTTARLNAVKLMDDIASKEPKIEVSRSHLLPLSGLSSATSAIETLYQGSEAWNLLLARYGEFAAGFCKLIDAAPSVLELAPGSSEIYKVEVAYFAQQDHTQCLVDLLYRRLNINIHKPISEETVVWCGQRMSVLKQWSETTLKENMNLALKREQKKAQLKIMLSNSEQPS